MQVKDKLAFKKSYAPPKLMAYGSICDLTQNVTFGTGVDNCSPPTLNRSINLGQSPFCP